MRTTIDLPDDLHRIASAIARDRSETLSQTVAGLLRRALGLDRRAGETPPDDGTGLPTIRVGHPITGDDVRAIDDPDVT